MNQPERSTADGQVNVRWSNDRPNEDLIISCTHEGKEQSMRVGAFNAWRLVALMAFCLKIHIKTKIKL